MERLVNGLTAGPYNRESYARWSRASLDNDSPRSMHFGKRDCGGGNTNGKVFNAAPFSLVQPVPTETLDVRPYTTQRNFPDSPSNMSKGGFMASSVRRQPFGASLSASQGFVPGTPLAGVMRSSPTAVQMNTAYTDISTIGKKKNPKTGDTLGLKGYTVGSRAPKNAKNSGTINQFGFGIDNLYGGKVDKKVESDVKGKIDADAGGAIGKIGTAWVGLTALWVLSNLGPQ